MFQRLLPVALLSTLLTACAQAQPLAPVTVGTSGGASTQASAAFVPTSLSLTLDAQAATLPVVGRLNSATQTDGYVAVLGLANGVGQQDGAASLTIALSQLTKSPAMPTFTAADSGHKELMLNLVKGTVTATYAADSTDALTIAVNAGKLDVSYTGLVSLTAGSSSVFKTQSNIAFKATGLPTSL